MVFSTLTLVQGSHASAMSQGWPSPAGHRSHTAPGDVVTEFRREAVRGGLITALRVTAYGDADWKV